MAHTQAWQHARTTLRAAEAVGAIKSVLRSVGVQSCLVTEGDTHVFGFLARKLVLAWIEEVKAKGKTQAIDWGEVSHDLLMEASADETGYLERSVPKARQRKSAISCSRDLT